MESELRLNIYWSHLIKVSFNEVCSGSLDDNPLDHNILILDINLKLERPIFPDNPKIRLHRINLHNTINYQYIPPQLVINIRIDHKVLFFR